MIMLLTRRDIKAEFRHVPLANLDSRCIPGTWPSARHDADQIILVDGAYAKLLQHPLGVACTIVPTGDVPALVGLSGGAS